MTGDFEMRPYLILAGFAAVGFVLWLAILKLWALYEERTPPEIQTRVYATAKNLPRDALNLVASCVLWSGMGALLLQFVLGLIGLDGWLPRTGWALPVVAFFVMGALFSFWDSPARSEEVLPRGRGLRGDKQQGARPATPPTKRTTGNTRGRTIRSYQDIK